jgi:hypothetical protein
MSWSISPTQAVLVMDETGDIKKARNADIGITCLLTSMRLCRVVLNMVASLIDDTRAALAGKPWLPLLPTVA